MKRLLIFTLSFLILFCFFSQGGEVLAQEKVADNEETKSAEETSDASGNENENHDDLQKNNSIAIEFVLFTVCIVLAFIIIFVIFAFRSLRNHAIKIECLEITLDSMKIAIEDMGKDLCDIINAERKDAQKDYNSERADPNQLSQVRDGKKDNSRNKKNTELGKEFDEGEPLSEEQIITLFNIWAEDPTESIPKGFSCLKGDIKFHKKQKIEKIPGSSLWITNLDGDPKFLLPNPFIFDRGTDISSLYNYKQNQVKPKGQNRIKINNPCKIGKNGYIEKKGDFHFI